MIESLESRLHTVLPERAMIDAMLLGIDRFESYRSALPFLAGGYTRTLLKKTNGFELVAMQWAPSSLSALHDHGDARCWVVVLDGALDVDNFDRLDDGEERAQIAHRGRLVVARGDVDHRLSRRELHRVHNARPESAYSLQLYSPEIGAYNVINERTGECTSVVAKYDAIVEL